MSLISDMEAATQRVKTDYNGRKVTAYKLSIASKIPITVETAWSKLITSELLEFIVKGKLKFLPLNGKFPKIWEQGRIVKTKMLLYGCIPFGGIHTLKFERIDKLNKIIKTKEKDAFAKIWNHKISLKPTEDNATYYKDEIIIYGGIFTRLILFWAKSFYKHRQKRWLLVGLKSKRISN